MTTIVVIGGATLLAAAYDAVVWGGKLFKTFKMRYDRHKWRKRQQRRWTYHEDF